MARLLVATTNRAKLREIRTVLAGTDFDLLTLADYPDIPPAPETGRSFEENARVKARYYAERTGELTVAEDSGLEIDALGGAPGVESARFGGEHTTYPEKFRLIYEALRERGAATSTARFVCAVALVVGVRPGGAPRGERAGAVLFETRGTVEGRVAPEPTGEGGFGYDPIFFYPPFGRTLAEASAQKSAVSHRGEAFRALRAFLESRA